MNKKQYRIKCYKIFWDEYPKDVYVGSTRTSLSSRIAQHRNDSRRPFSEQNPVMKIMKKNGIDKMKYVLLESYMVNCRDEQLKYEHEWRNKVGTVNQIYRIVKTFKKGQTLTYTLGKVKCHCNGSYSTFTKQSGIKHFNTDKHKKFVALIVKKIFLRSTAYSSLRV